MGYRVYWEVTITMATITTTYSTGSTTRKTRRGRDWNPPPDTRLTWSKSVLRVEQAKALKSHSVEAIVARMDERTTDIAIARLFVQWLESQFTNKHIHMNASSDDCAMYIDLFCIDNHVGPHSQSVLWHILDTWIMCAPDDTSLLYELTAPISRYVRGFSFWLMHDVAVNFHGMSVESACDYALRYSELLAQSDLHVKPTELMHAFYYHREYGDMWIRLM